MDEVKMSKPSGSRGGDGSCGGEGKNERSMKASRNLSLRYIVLQIRMQISLSAILDCVHQPVASSLGSPSTAQFLEPTGFTYWTPFAFFLDFFHSFSVDVHIHWL